MPQHCVPHETSTLEDFQQPDSASEPSTLYWDRISKSFCIEDDVTVITPSIAMTNSWRIPATSRVYQLQGEKNKSGKVHWVEQSSCGAIAAFLSLYVACRQSAHVTPDQYFTKCDTAIALIWILYLNTSSMTVSSSSSNNSSSITSSSDSRNNRGRSISLNTST